MYHLPRDFIKHVLPFDGREPLKTQLHDTASTIGSKALMVTVISLLESNRAVYLDFFLERIRHVFFSTMHQITAFLPRCHFTIFPLPIMLQVRDVLTPSATSCIQLIVVLSTPACNISQ